MANIKLQLDSFSGLQDLVKDEALRQSKIQTVLSYLLENRPKKGSTDELFYENSIDILCQILGEKVVCETLALDTELQMRKKYREINSYDSAYLSEFGKNLGIKYGFDTHVSVKILGLNVDLIYEFGDLTKVIIPYYFTTPLDITDIVLRVVENQNILNIAEWQDLDKATVQSKLVLPVDDYNNYLNDLQINTNEIQMKNVILQILKTQDEKYIDSLHVLSFGFISDGFTFNTKSEEFDYLEELNFELPMNWLVTDMHLDSIAFDIHNTLVDCSNEMLPNSDGSNAYPYITDGIIISLDDNNIKEKAGFDGRYSRSDLLVQLGYWKPEIITGYVQTIYWKQTKDTLQPYAIIGEEPNMIPLVKPYIFELDNIDKLDNLGILYKGKTYKSIPLCNPYMILILDAYPEFSINFSISKHIGAIPCYEETPMMQQVIQTFVMEEDIYGK